MSLLQEEGEASTQREIYLMFHFNIIFNFTVALNFTKFQFKKAHFSYIFFINKLDQYFVSYSW